MYTVLPQPTTINPSPISFQVTPQVVVTIPEIQFGGTFVEEFEKFGGTEVTLQRFAKEVVIYRNGMRLRKVEYKVKGKNISFIYPFETENLVIQYVQDSNNY